jgi:diguanylate cyclase (GGDEF)-like protein/PAS domain S-box-containing protein
VTPQALADRGAPSRGDSPAGGGAEASLFQQVLECSVVGLALVDASGRYLRANPEFCRLTGYSEPELLQLTLEETIDADPGGRVLPLFGGRRTGSRTPRREHEPRPLGDRRTANTRVTRTWITSGPGAAHLQLIQIEDLGRRHDPEPVVTQTERQGTIAGLSQRALRGLPIESLLEEVAAAIARILHLDTGVVRSQPRSPSHRHLPILVGGRPYAHIDLGRQDAAELLPEDLQFLHEIAGVASAAIERQEAEDRIRHEASHDPLTGLANRTLLIDRLGLALARARRSGGTVAVLFCDLDHFKEINDRLGHAAGDAVLAEVAARLQTTMRLEDTIARVGGDEFVMVCGEVSGAEEAKLIARRVGEALGQPLDVCGGEVFAACSIGIAVTARPEVCPEDLIAQADLAMYRAKASGTGEVALLSEIHASSD